MQETTTYPPIKSASVGQLKINKKIPPMIWLREQLAVTTKIVVVDMPFK